MRTSSCGLVRLPVAAVGALAGSLLVVVAVADDPPDRDHPAPPAAPAKRPMADHRAGQEAARPMEVRLRQRRQARPVSGEGISRVRGVGRPRQVIVPALDVRAPVVPIEAEGRALLPPADPTTVGWWSDGARAGSAVGAAVVTGHTVSTGGGAFDDLDRLRPGDTVRVRTTRGMLAYVVHAVAAYPKQSLARHAQRLFGQTTPGRLVLVTCEDWNGEAYLSNQVVVARPA